MFVLKDAQAQTLLLLLLLYQAYGCKERTKTQELQINEKKTREKLNNCINKQETKSSNSS